MYRPNDAYNHIHWPSSARKGELYVRQFDRDTAGDVWLLLDMDAGAHLGSGAASTEEHAVLLAASLVARALAQHRAVGLAAYGATPKIVPPGRGQGHQWRLLEVLALVTTAQGEEHTLARAVRDLRRSIRPGSAVLVITPRADAGWLGALSELTHSRAAVTVTLFDRASYGGEGNSDNLRQEIQRLGMQADVIPQSLLEDLVTPPSEQGQFEIRVTPFGRAVVIKQPAAVKADDGG
jgi:uncharacterized protein (DUF58 family)